MRDSGPPRPRGGHWRDVEDLPPPPAHLFLPDGYNLQEGMHPLQRVRKGAVAMSEETGQPTEG